MLPISTMAVAVVLGSACGTNMATMNDYNAGLYNGSNNPRNVCYQHGNQDLDCILSQMGASAPSGNSCSGFSNGMGFQVILIDVELIYL